MGIFPIKLIMIYFPWVIYQHNNPALSATWFFKKTFYYEIQKYIQTADLV